MLFTYVYPAWPALPYLSVGGAKDSGKSTVFDVLCHMVFRPLRSSNVTGPLLFRMLHEQGGTLLLDEAERLQDSSPEFGVVRTVLLSGYKVGTPASRLDNGLEDYERPSWCLAAEKPAHAFVELIGREEL